MFNVVSNAICWLKEAVIPLTVSRLVEYLIVAVALYFLQIIYRTTRPELLVLDRLANKKEKCVILIRSHTDVLEGSPPVYITRWSDPRSPDQPIETNHPHIPSVYASADVQASVNFSASLGIVSKAANAELLAANELGSLPEENLACIGGGNHSRLIINKADLGGLTLDDSGFKIEGHNKSLTAYRASGSNEEIDFGLILKYKSEDTGKMNFVIMGMGSFGTEYASHYFKRSLPKLGKLYGRRNFAVLVLCPVSAGKQSAVEYWFHPQPPRWRRLLYFSTWKAFKKNYGKVENIPKVFRNSFD
jgi:hypothetical protein